MTVNEVVAIFKDHNGVMSFQEILNFFKSDTVNVNSFFSILTKAIRSETPLIKGDNTKFSYSLIKL